MEYCVDGEFELNKDAPVFDNTDVVQGEIDDCWFLSAIILVASRKALMEQVLLTRDTSDSGAYLARFHIDGQWQSVLVDDMLPCMEDVEGAEAAVTPVFARSKAGHNLWCQLIEKAYAKLFVPRVVLLGHRYDPCPHNVAWCRHGSYQALKGGHVHVGLSELTGGAANAIYLKAPDVRTRITDGTMWTQLKQYRRAVCVGLLGACALWRGSSC